MLSMILPTLNPGVSLASLLDQIQSQTRPPHEILIIDSASTDDTLSIAHRYGAKTIAIARKDFDHGRTRTLAAKAARGDILIFMTQDALPANSQSFQNLLAAFEDPRIVAAYGRQLPYPDTSLFGRFLREFNYPATSTQRTLADIPTYGIKTAFLSNSFCAYRRSALESIGWFKPGLILGEDMVAGAQLLNAGYTLAYVADAEVFHAHSYTIFQEFQRYFKIGVFHRREPGLLKEFGKADSEGFRYAREEISFLWQKKQWGLIPWSLVRNATKMLGYQLGKRNG
jgi:rhamnosyltransferase